MHAKLSPNNALLAAHVALMVGVLLTLAPHSAFADHCPAGQAHDAAGNCSTLAGASTTTLAANPELSNQGIFGCLGAGAQVANVGTTRAIGGVYVPVNDAAVTLNTGFLVYKECILDGMARNIAQNVSAEYTRQQIESFNTSRGGNAQYVRNIGGELTELILANTATQLSDESLSSMCAAFRQPIQRTLARAALLNANSPGAIYTCPADINSGGYAGWFAAVEPRGNIVGTMALAADRVAKTSAELERNTRQMWDWGRGVYSVFDTNADPRARNILTPGFVIADAISQATGSGFRQLEHANEIDQIVSNLFGGLTTRLLSSGSGIPGLFVTTGTQPAYIDRMVAQTQAAVRTGAVNAALNILAAARQTEAAYLEAKQGTGNEILQTITQLRSYERQCWSLIAYNDQGADKHVCTSPPQGNTCTSAGGVTLTIATSTQFSDAIIDDPANNIRGLGTTTAAQITTSEQTLALLEQLITQVTNTSSSAVQQQALLQLDQMVANNQLHSAQDAQAAADQRGAVTSALNTLEQNTLTTWADSQDANIGWCNINNPAVIQRWLDAWR